MDNLELLLVVQCLRFVFSQHLFVVLMVLPILVPLAKASNCAFIGSLSFGFEFLVDSLSLFSSNCKGYSLFVSSSSSCAWLAERDCPFWPYWMCENKVYCMEELYTEQVHLESSESNKINTGHYEWNTNVNLSDVTATQPAPQGCLWALMQFLWMESFCMPLQHLWR